MKNHINHLLAAVVVMVAALLPAIAVQHGSVQTTCSPGVRIGTYQGNGTTVQISTALSTADSVRIVEVTPRGPTLEAYTTRTIQAVHGHNIFINGNRKDAGVAIESGNFTVTNNDFNAEGHFYNWEAHGNGGCS